MHYMWGVRPPTIYVYLKQMYTYIQFFTCSLDEYSTFIIVLYFELLIS